MEELGSLVAAAQSGDRDAYGKIVRRFQDMACGYAFSILGDFHLAEDAAQEAFIEGYRDLANLRKPAAFPGWFRRIVFKRCDRIRRGKQVATVPLEAAGEVSSGTSSPAETAQKREMKDRVLDVIRSLPETERTATTLFYINGYSQEEVADFLEVPVTTVDNRLRASRKRLRQRMMQMVSDELKTHAPASDFPERIRLLLELPRPLEIQGHPVREMWDVFRSCFPGFETVDLDEVTVEDTGISLVPAEVLEEGVHRVDGQRVLRPEFTSQVFDQWLTRGGGIRKWMAAGRVFRKLQEGSAIRNEAFHQAEVLWCEQGLKDRDCVKTILDVANRILPGIQCRVGVHCSYGPFPTERDYEAKWRGQWLSIAQGGTVADDWLQKARLDPKRFGVISFAFGLERCAQVRYDLDDIRKLWQPPYVPS